MPEHEEHCLHSEKRYGVRGDEIHAWMDEPSSVVGVSHRQFRHSIEDLPTAIQMFGKQYGAELVENIFLDHLKADSEENRKHEEMKIQVKEKLSILTFSIPSDSLTIEGLSNYLASVLDCKPRQPIELLNDVHRTIKYLRVYEAIYNVNQVFKTSIGVVHRENCSNARLYFGLDYNNNCRKYIDFLGLEIPFAKPHDDFVGNFPFLPLDIMPISGALSAIKSRHSRQINYRGHSNRRVYHKFFEIKDKNIQINSIHLLCVPIIRLEFKLGQMAYYISGVQNMAGRILQLENNLQIKIGNKQILCDICGRIVSNGGSIETVQGFQCAKCGRMTCRKDGYWRKKNLFFSEFICPFCLEEGKGYKKFDMI